jgi:hypothetical protein
MATAFPSIRLAEANGSADCELALAIAIALAASPV